MTDPRPVKHYVRQALELVEAYKALLGERQNDRALAKLLQANHILADVIPGLPTYTEFCANPANPFVQSYHELCAVVTEWLPQKQNVQSESLPNAVEDDLALRFERLRVPRSLPKSGKQTAAPPPLPAPAHSSQNSSQPAIDRPLEKEHFLVVSRQSKSPPAHPPPPPPTCAVPAPAMFSTLGAKFRRPSIPKQPPPQIPVLTKRTSSKTDAAPVVDVATLDGYIKYIPDLIVLLDIRDRDKFDRCHIDAPWVVCLEPVSLRPNMSDADLEDSLVIAPESEVKAFAARHSVKHVVLYTQTSKSGIERMAPVSYVFEALKAAGINPTILDGGFDAWARAVLPVVATTVSRDRSPFEMEDLSVQPVDSAGPFGLPHTNASGDWIVEGGSLAPSLGSLPSVPSVTSPIQMPDFFGSSVSSVSASSVPYSPPQLPPLPLSHDDTAYRAFTAKYPEVGMDSGYQPLQAQRLQTQQFSTRSGVSPQPIPRPVRHIQPPLYTLPPVDIPSIPAPNEPRSRLPSPSGLPGPSTPAGPAAERIRVTWPKSQKYHRALSYCTGLANLGNTCYMNCILQCLEGTPQLAVPFLDRSYKQYVNVKSRLGYQGRMANEFAALTLAMERAGTGGYVAPRGMKNLAGQLNETFAGRDQQDCQEFLVFVLDGLHEDLNLNGHRERLRELDEHEERVRERYNVRLASTIEWERYLKSDTSLIVDMFQGQYMSRLKCMVCGTTSSNYTAFSTLSLPLAAGRSIDLHQCFAQFVAPEILDGDDAWFCSHCKRKQRTVKTMSISRLPPVLIIHLKRFRRTLRSVDKLETPVSYPLHNLDLTGYWPNPEVTDPDHLRRLAQLPKRGQQPPFRYNLYAVTAHDGSLKSGHYTAFVSKPGTGWCHYDDIHITRVPDHAAITNKAYLLFYQRI